MNDDARKGKAARARGKAAKASGKARKPGKAAAGPACAPRARSAVADRPKDAVESHETVRSRVKHLAADAPATARGVYATGRAYALRGAETVTRVAADNSALTTLVAGAAVAAIGWLVLGRGRKDGGEG